MNGIEFIGGSNFYPPDENDLLVKNFLEAKTAFEQDLNARQVSVATLSSDDIKQYRDFLEYYLTHRKGGMADLGREVILKGGTRVFVRDDVQIGLIYNSQNEVIGVTEL
jgi:hypothetical protein